MGQEPDQNTPSPARSYVERVMNNLTQEAEDLDRCRVELFNETVLEVKRMQKPHLWTYEDEETGEEIEYESDDFAEVLGFAFVVTTGGPHLQFETTDQGRTWTGHYWDWFMSDQEKVTLDGSDCDTLHDVLGHWFDAYSHGHPYEMETGKVADLSAEEAVQRLNETAPRWHPAHAPRRPFGTQEVTN